MVRVAAVLVGAQRKPSQLTQLAEVGEPEGAAGGQPELGAAGARHALGAGGARVQGACQASNLLVGDGGGARGRQPPPQRVSLEHHMPRPPPASRAARSLDPRDIRSRVHAHHWPRASTRLTADARRRALPTSCRPPAACIVPAWVTLLI